MARDLKRHALLAALALLSAGCVGMTADEPIDAAAAANEPSEGAADSAPGEDGEAPGDGSGSGSTTPPPEEPAEQPASPPEESEDEAEAATPPSSALTTFEIAFAGATGTSLSTCRGLPDGTQTCQGTGRIGGATTYDPAFDAAILTYQVEARWEAQTPLTETLRLTLEVCDPTACQPLVVEGESPLTLQGSMTGEWGSPRVSVTAVATALPDGSHVSAERDQEFMLTGTLVGKAREPGAPAFAARDGA